MGKIVVPNAIERRKGYLYYIDHEGNLCEAKMKNGDKIQLNKQEVIQNGRTD